MIVLIHICEMDMAVGIADPDVILPAHLIQYLVSVTAIRVMYVILELFYLTHTVISSYNSLLYSRMFPEI